MVADHICFSGWSYLFSGWPASIHVLTLSCFFTGGLLSVVCLYMTEDEHYEGAPKRGRNLYETMHTTWKQLYQEGKITKVNGDCAKFKLVAQRKKKIDKSLWQLEITEKTFFENIYDTIWTIFKAHRVRPCSWNAVLIKTISQCHFYVIMWRIECICGDKFQFAVRLKFKHFGEQRLQQNAIDCYRFLILNNSFIRMNSKSRLSICTSEVWMNLKLLYWI